MEKKKLFLFYSVVNDENQRRGTKKTKSRFEQLLVQCLVPLFCFMDRTKSETVHKEYPLDTYVTHLRVSIARPGRVGTVFCHLDVGSRL